MGEKFVVDFICVLNVIDCKLVLRRKLIQPYFRRFHERRMNPSRLRNSHYL